MVFRTRLVALPCTWAKGGFSGERVFTISLANGEPYESVAPRDFFWNASGQLIGDSQPDVRQKGMIAARVIDQLEDDQVLVEIPDGEVIAVAGDLIKERPSQINPPTPQPTYVSLRS